MRTEPLSNFWTHKTKSQTPRHQHEDPLPATLLGTIIIIIIILIIILIIIGMPLGCNTEHCPDVHMHNYANAYQYTTFDPRPSRSPPCHLNRSPDHTLPLWRTWPRTPRPHSAVVTLLPMGLFHCDLRWAECHYLAHRRCNDSLWRQIPGTCVGVNRIRKVRAVGDSVAKFRSNVCLCALVRHHARWLKGVRCPSTPSP